MCHIKISLIEIDITSVEVEEWIIRSSADGIIIIFLCFFKFANMIKSEASVIIVESVRIKRYGLRE